MKTDRPTLSTTAASAFDLDSLLHPAQAFEQPQDVIRDPDLTVNEKRAILASWASDARAVEAAPALQRSQSARRAVSVDKILGALRSLDRQANAEAPRSSWTRRQVRRRSVEEFRTRQAREQIGPSSPRVEASGMAADPDRRPQPSRRSCC
jgi:hypothetical protein